MNKLFIVTDVPPQRVSGINIAENVRNKMDRTKAKRIKGGLHTFADRLLHIN